ncbi:MAG TPA: hypothetical protein VJT32_07810 [bacterium]|nr:hypothetical protein [bacterium]
MTILLGRVVRPGLLRDGGARVLDRPGSGAGDLRDALEVDPAGFITVREVAL